MQKSFPIDLKDASRRKKEMCLMQKVPSAADDESGHIRDCPRIGDNFLSLLELHSGGRSRRRQSGNAVVGDFTDGAMAAAVNRRRWRRRRRLRGGGPLQEDRGDGRRAGGAQQLPDGDDFALCQGSLSLIYVPAISTNQLLSSSLIHLSFLKLLNTVQQLLSLINSTGFDN